MYACATSKWYSDSSRSFATASTNVTDVDDGQGKLSGSNPRYGSA